MDDRGEVLGVPEPMVPKSDYDVVVSENVSLKEELATLKSQHAALGEKHAEALAKLPPEKAAYVYGDDECRPVAKVVGSECPRCHWTFGGKELKDREPHAIL